MLQRIPFINPATGNPLIREAEVLVDAKTKNHVAPIIEGIPRFVPSENYADSFGWQWNHWAANRDRRSGFNLMELVLSRTQFREYDLKGKSILECGMGGGDDTEILLTLPFGEVHSFDLSNAVERGQKMLRDERLTISQASIYEIPYEDQAFDVVYCHRVLQHTPDPVAALRAICKKVKPGGILFAHSYKRSKTRMRQWRYKYLWLTQRMPHKYVYYFLQIFGWPLHFINAVFYKIPGLRQFARQFIPFYRKADADVHQMSLRQVVEVEKLITFDALTPAHDHPMTGEEFFGSILEEGFEIETKFDNDGAIQFCTARKL